MGCAVYANNNMIACKAADGKTIAATPDVCFTPPLTPATPPGVPIPYPNTAMASDTTDGTKTVMINDQEVMIKNKSNFKTSTGDEAGSAPKHGIVTSKIKGKANFCAWSMDVKFEGENVPRHLDLTGHNEASDPPNTPPWTYLDGSTIAPGDHPCKAEIDEAQKACKSSVPVPVGARMHRICDDKGKCEKAMACILVPKGQDKELCCSPNNTGHHMIEVHWVKGNAGFPMAQGSSASSHGNPNDLTVCVNAQRSEGNHKSMHDIQGVYEESYKPGGARFEPGSANGGWNYEAGKKASLNAHDATFQDSNCSTRCMESQLDGQYGDNQSRPLNPPGTQPLGSGRSTTLSSWGDTLSGS